MLGGFGRRRRWRAGLCRQSECPAAGRRRRRAFLPPIDVRRGMQGPGAAPAGHPGQPGWPLPIPRTFCGCRPATSGATAERPPARSCCSTSSIVLQISELRRRGRGRAAGLRPGFDRCPVGFAGAGQPAGGGGAAREPRWSPCAQGRAGKGCRLLQSSCIGLRRRLGTKRPLLQPQGTASTAQCSAACR